MTTFEQMDLPSSLIARLKQMEFHTPTPIQAQAIPLALEGKDILGSAQTGTGKTGAFGIPIVAKLTTEQRGVALVMTPTRELATQVMAMLKIMLGKPTNIKTALLIGGESMPKQLQQLRMNPRLIIGTPGRINDHLQRRSLKLHDADFLVLDETDRMLDMGFSVQIEEVLKFMTAKRQTLLFSATLPKNIIRIANKYLNDPQRVAIEGSSIAVAAIRQDIEHVASKEKYTKLLTELETREGSILIFVKTKYRTERLAVKISKAGHQADAIHGDLRQSRRDRVIESFRKKKYRILVATDIAARGLDIPHIEHVINYDLPQSPEDYIHRIGRTGRAGATGTALNLITPEDMDKWRAIETILQGGNPNQQSDKKFSARGENRKPGRRSRKKPSRDNKEKTQSPKDNNKENTRSQKANGGAKPKQSSPPKAHNTAPQKRKRSKINRSRPKSVA